jgi:hypothetical protein
MTHRLDSLFLRAVRVVATGAVAVLAACGGGGGNDAALRGSQNLGVGEVAAPPIAGSNVMQIVVDRGTDGSSINTPFVTVRVCQPGSGNCVDIDHVVLDTGSSGLRIAASALPADFALTPVLTPGGQRVGQCAQFASGFSWGSVRVADVRMGAEVAGNVSIQVVNDAGLQYSQIPASCSTTGPNIGSGRGAKGILGVGFFRQDCGPACDVPATTPPNFYYACQPGGGCTETRLALASQVSNPVMSFAANNNGVVLVMPAVPSGGAARATGSLVLGVGTQTNNRLGDASVFTADAAGYFTTTYRGVTYRNSFLDSGSNGLFFNDDIPECGDFYCPNASPLRLSAINRGASGGGAGVVDFFIDSVRQIRADAAAAHIGGTNSIPDSFDWGMPFFYGRSVFVGFAAPDGPGPFWAY